MILRKKKSLSAGWVLQEHFRLASFLHSPGPQGSDGGHSRCSRHGGRPRCVRARMGTRPRKLPPCSGKSLGKPTGNSRSARCRCSGTSSPRAALRRTRRVAYGPARGGGTGHRCILGRPRRRGGGERESRTEQAHGDPESLQAPAAFWPRAVPLSAGRVAGDNRAHGGRCWPDSPGSSCQRCSGTAGPTARGAGAAPGQPGLTRPSGLRREHGAAWRHGAARAAAPQAANDATPGAGCPNRWRALRLWPRPRPLGGGAPALPRPSARRLAERPRPAAQPYLLARVATWTAAGPRLAGSLGTGNECGVHRRGAARLRPGPRLHGGRWARGGSWWQVGTGQMVPIARADTRCPSQGSWLRTRSRRAPRTLTCPP